MSIDTLLNVYSYHEIKDLGFVVCPAQAEKVKSICSYQFNIWYVGHVSTQILI